MIQLTESLIAVEVPKGSKSIFVSHWPKSNPELMYLTRKDNPVSVKLTYGVKYSLIGVTPLLEEQWKEIVGSHTSSEKMYCNETPYQIPVSPKDRWNDLQRHKGLDINKKYAIIQLQPNTTD